MNRQDAKFAKKKREKFEPQRRKGRKQVQKEVNHRGTEDTE
jgi:hypothetical protein